jgi:imidazolonepropionase-like amidohydrolase
VTGDSTGRPVAIQCGRLLDVQAGQAAADRVLHVGVDGRVTAAAPASDGIPDGAAIIDLSRYTVLPGLIDVHTHLVGNVQTAGVPSTTTSAAEEVLIGVRHARQTLEAGFTTVRDVGSFRAFTDCALRDAIDAGDVVGPRMQCAGAFITAPWGGGDVVGLARDIELPEDLRFGVVRSVDEVRERVRRLLIGGADLIKCIGTGAVLTRGGVPGAPELSEAELRAAVEEAAWYDAFVAVHAHGAEGAKRAIRAGARTIEHGSYLDDEAISMLADTGTFFSVDLYDGEWALEHGVLEGWPAETMRKLDESQVGAEDVLRRAIGRGVRIVFGTDSGVYPHGLNARNFAWYTRCGMTPLDAIRTATTVAAEAMGWSDRVGSLAVGRYADLVTVAGDPLDDLTELERPMAVVKGGQSVFEAPGARA